MQGKGRVTNDLEMVLPRKGGRKGALEKASGFLDGQMLVAMPAMNDERFNRSVIYICAHSSEGAMGIIVNHPAPNISFPELLVQLDVIADGEGIQLPNQAETVRVLKGGPVETGRGFVLHSADYVVEDATLPIDDGVCLTATLDILKAIASGEGPRSAVLALGYAGWAPGQLEQEIQSNGWLHCPADPELLFGPNVEQKYNRALQKIGIHPGMLSSDAGHA
jgi:putative transcriptional regulator